MIIGTSGFSGSGSSAVSDFLMEFEENQVYTDIEFILAYFPDGLEDLDFHLNKSCSKFLSSCTAIPRFRKAANYLLGIVTKGKIKELTDEYLDSITQVKWLGTGQGQDLLHNLWLYRNLGIRINMRLMKFLPPWLCKSIKLYPLDRMEFSIQPDNFYELTQQYTDKILQTLGLNLSKNIVLDQPFAGNDPKKSLPYYRDARAIIVDRDPRDIYAMTKGFFRRICYQFPLDNVKGYVVYYRNMHKTMEESKNDPNVLYIMFEDLVYNYEATTKKIIDFLGLKHHTRKRECFIPEVSMINTQMFKKCPELESEIKYIEENLKDYLYDFDAYDYNPIEQKVFVDNPRLRK